jgi:hypothetical protein
MSDIQAAAPPILDPEAFERHEGFRETTLAQFTDPDDNRALRRFGDLLYSMALEYGRHWPREPEGSFRHQVRAALADLRHLQGYLSLLGREHEASALTESETRLSHDCAGVALKLKATADALEEELR